MARHRRVTEMKLTTDTFRHEARGFRTRSSVRLVLRSEVIGNGVDEPGTKCASSRIRCIIEAFSAKANPDILIVEAMFATVAP